MLPRWLNVLFLLLHEAWSVRRDAHIRFLMLQVDLLKERLPGNRVILTPAERRRLLKIGEEVNHRIKDSLGIVRVKTYRRWLCEAGVDRQAVRVGRPRLSRSLCKLVLRLARENANWGVRRMVGELKKLGLRASRSTVRRILIDEKILPDPHRRAPVGVQTPWRKFLALHLNVMVACDFFCKTVWTPLGRKTAYVLVFIHLGSRRVFLSPSTYHPTEAWVCQQARNVGMWAAEQGIDIRFLIHDHDSKFTEKFDSYFRHDDTGVVLTPIAAPIANCYAESWIGHSKREVLNHLFCFSLRQLDYITQTYADYHNTYRPHQGLGNRPPSSPDRSAPEPKNTDVVLEHIHRRTWLGGLLSHYYRQAG